MPLWGQLVVEKLGESCTESKYLIIFLFPFNFFSLLDILAGRKNKKGLQGTVLVNGEPQPRDFKCMSGYVVQVLQRPALEAENVASL